MCEYRADMDTTEKIAKLLKEYPAEGKAIRVFQKKSNGGKRPIAKPNKELNKWLKVMNSALVKHFNAWPDFMHGGIKKRSYVTYARPHVNQQCVITIDMRECFDSITTSEIADALEVQLHLPHDIAELLAKKLCFRGKLAQGFATSNYLSNLYLAPQLTKLNEELSHKKAVLSNYVDDIALSGPLSKKDEIINTIAVSLSQIRLAINKAKIEVMPSSRQQIICGLVVNKRISLTRALKLRLMSDVANLRMSESSAQGWVANLNGIDKSFRDKFYDYALKKGVLKTKSK